MVIMADGVKCRLILSHYFIPFYNGARHMAFMLHGHTHKTEESAIEERIKDDIRQRGLRCEAYNVADIRNTTYQGVDAYIGTGTFSFNYSYEGSHQTKDDEAWNLVSSGKKKVGDLELKKHIKKGVAIVQL